MQVKTAYSAQKYARNATEYMGLPCKVKARSFKKCPYPVTCYNKTYMSVNRGQYSHWPLAAPTKYESWPRRFTMSIWTIRTDCKTQSADPNSAKGGDKESQITTHSMSHFFTKASDFSSPLKVQQQTGVFFGKYNVYQTVSVRIIFLSNDKYISVQCKLYAFYSCLNDALMFCFSTVT